MYGGLVSDLLSVVLQTHQALYEKTQSCYLGENTHTHTHTHTLSNLYLNERLDCCIFLIKYNIKMINNADVCFYFATIFDHIYQGGK